MDRCQSVAALNSWKVSAGLCKKRVPASGGLRLGTWSQPRVLAKTQNMHEIIITCDKVECACYAWIQTMQQVVIQTTVYLCLFGHAWRVPALFLMAQKFVFEAQ